MKRRITIGLATLFVFGYFVTNLRAQNPVSSGNISGSFQSDVQYLFPDSIIGAEAVDEKVLSNSYLQLTYQKDNFSAGIRYEAYLNPLLGFDRRYEGQGIAYRFASYQTDKLDLTVGNFYDQFGSGIVFRSYQEWTLGIDNSIDGVRLKFDPTPGVSIKGIIGKQRNFWDKSASIIRGADLDLSLNEILPPLKESKTKISLGGSVVSKYQEDDDVNLRLPENVMALSGRARLLRGGFNMDAEYAYKINDPINRNGFSYNPGQAFFLNTAYSQKGFGVTASFKRLDNMDFRSERSVSLQELTLNFLPAISRFHTYRLPTLYPYATQPNGEVGFQASVFYTIPRGSKLGGKYGTQISVNYSRIHGLDTAYTDFPFRYQTNFNNEVSTLFGFQQERLFFRDINFDISRKWNKKFTTIFTYINMVYDVNVIQLGSFNGGADTVQAQIGVVELQYKIKRKVALRTEFQYMHTKQDMGSWAMILAELSFSPHWYITLFDEYNFGNPEPEKRVHYYNAQVAYAFNSNRLSFGYSRQRQGLLCVGGICREVPASNGFALSITSSF
ncbi:MAG: DUF6029 family protein [Bacteroidia bacterium]